MYPNTVLLQTEQSERADAVTGQLMSPQISHQTWALSWFILSETSAALLVLRSALF